MRTQKELSIILGLILTATCVPGLVQASPLLPSSDRDARQVEKNWIPNETKAPAVDKPLGNIPSLSQQQGAFYVSSIHFDDVTNVDEVQDLRNLARPYTKRTVQLSELQQLAGSIHNYYYNKGYMLATAVLPDQSVTGGVLTMKIYYGHIDEVKLVNKSHFLTERLLDFARAVKKGELIRQRKIDDVVNNIDNLHGLRAHGILSPGSIPGTANLTITVWDRKADASAVYVDNAGNKMTGSYHIGFNEQLENLNRTGDMLTFGASTTNKHTNNFNIGYEVPVGSRGSLAGLSFSRMNYSYQFNDFINSTGRANTYSIYGKTPVLNDGWRLMNTVYGYDHRDIRDEYELAGTSLDMFTDKHSDACYIGLSGHYNTPKYYTGYNLFFRNGFVNYENTAEDKQHFNRYNLDMVHVQHMKPHWDMRFNLHAQTSNQSLDSSEQMSLGGMNGVRAYPQGEATGDKGFQYTGELVYKTGFTGLSLSAYIDGGYVVQNSTDTGRHLTGFGFGIEYLKPLDWYLRLDYARKINAEYNYAERTDDKDRFWFQVYKLF